MPHQRKNQRKRTAIEVPEPPPPMQKRDWILLGALILIYSLIAFHNLGNFHSPVTTWIMEESILEPEPAYFALDGVEFVSRFQFMNGGRHHTPFNLYASNDGDDWRLVHSIRNIEVFRWYEFSVNEYAQFFRIQPETNRLRLQEVAFRGVDDRLLPVTSTVEALVDEQHLVPERRTFMNSTYFDEIYHPRTGYEFVHGLAACGNTTVFEWTHPPMGKNFIAMSVAAFGMTPFAWRLPGTLFGIFMIPLLYFFARDLLKSNGFALFAAFIFTFDFMLFAQTRLATIDTYVVFFVIAMYFCMYRYIIGMEANTLKRSLTWLALCGVMMGFAIASKWQGVYGALGLPILFFPALYKLYLRDLKQAKTIFFACFAFFIAIPLAIYVLSYIPFVRATGWDWTSIWRNQQMMFRYHDGLTETHSGSSRWWQWPLLIRPLWLYVTHHVLGSVQGIMVTMGSPAVWWFGIPITIFAIFMAFKKWNEGKTDYALIFLLVGYAAQFIPWIPVSRITFIYHYFPSVPFVVIIIAWVFKNYIHKSIAFVYSALVLALFVLFYPVLSGVPTSIDYISTYLRWFESWFHWL